MFRTTCAIFLFFVPVLALAASPPTYTLDKDPVRLGRKALEEGRWSDAAKAFQEAVEAGYQVPKATFGLAEVANHQGRFSEAETLYRRAIEGAGKFPEARAALGLVILKQENRVAEADQALSQALAEDADLWTAEYGRARVLLIQKKPAEAKALLDHGAKKKGLKDGEDLYHHGMALYWLQMNNLDAAEKEALSAFALNASNPDINYLVGTVYQLKKTPYLAVQAFETALATPGATPSAPFLDQLGLLYEEVNQPNQARDTYLKAVAVDSMYAPSLLHLAGLLHRGGQPESAARAYLRYVSIEPHDVNGYVGLSNACFDAGRMDEALKAAEAAMAQDSTHADARLAFVRSGLRSANQVTQQRAVALAGTLPDSVVTAPADKALILYQRGMLQIKHGDPKAAIPLLEQAVSLDPKTTLYQLNLAVAFLQAKDGVAARAALRGTLALDPNLALAHIMLGQALVSADSARSAEAEFQKALEIEPKNASAWRGLGYCQIQRGAYAEAADSYRKATSIDADSEVASPQSADGWSGLGSAYLGLQKWTEAETAFKHALSIDPKNPSALRGLELLKKAGH
jgi:tetratricopeptide (TPR) repeat protein